MTGKPKILIVDDKKQNLVALRQVLQGLEVDIIEASSGNEALSATLDHNFALAILDVMMPGMSGFELATHLRGDNTTRLTPIIFVTAAYPDEFHVFSGYEAGGVDYIVKPYAPEILLAKVRIFLELDRQRQELQKQHDQLEILVAERTAELEYELSEHKRAEAALFESEKRYRRITEAITDYMYTVHIVEGRAIKTIHGPGCVAVTGYTDEEYAADPSLWLHMVVLEDRRAVADQTQKVLTDDESFELEHRIIHKNGSVRWVKNSLIPRYDEQGNLQAYDGLIQDITEKKQLEEQLRQAQKMEAVGQLAGGVAHDFNNILTVIMGYGHLLLMDGKLENPQKEEVEQILSSVEKASQLTSGLLAFSRKQVIVPKLQNLNDIVQHVQKFLLRVIGEDIQIKLVINKLKLLVNVDTAQIEQVLINLVTNARDAMQKGGLITIETGFQETEPMVENSKGYFSPGHYACISVSDTGRGMDEETLNKIFEPFFTTKEAGKGTGLGMAIVYGIVKQHNGFINIYSEPGCGSIFKIYIPIAEADQAVQEEITVKPLPVGGCETILLAEDDANVRKLVVNVLTKFGYEVIQANDGQEAVEMFATHRSRINLILMDMIMPRKNGRDAYEEICRLQSGVKVLYSSGYTADFIQDRGVSDEGINLVMKPVQPLELLRKVREILDS